MMGSTGLITLSFAVSNFPCISIRSFSGTTGTQAMYNPQTQNREQKIFHQRETMHV